MTIDLQFLLLIIVIRVSLKHIIIMYKYPLHAHVTAIEAILNTR